jgi:quercetin dioxygenase-like cupin family protein
MQRAPGLALDLPLRILIRADESGAVFVDYHDPETLVEPYGLDSAPLQAVAVIAAAVAAPGPVPAVDPVTRVVILDQKLPKPRTVGHVEVRRITMAPDVAAGPHVHNGPVFGHILTGSVTFQVEDEPPTVLHAGDVFYEPEAVRITRFDATADGVEFLGYFPLGPGEQAALTPVD